MDNRRFLIGQRSKTGKGDFVVLRETHDNYIIQYTSGAWKGKYIAMPKVVGDIPKVKRVESLRLSKPEMNKFLDMFYDEFKSEYTHVYYYKTDNPTTKQMFDAIREEYLPLFQIILNRFLQST